MSVLGRLGCTQVRMVMPSGVGGYTHAGVTESQTAVLPYRFMGYSLPGANCIGRGLGTWNNPGSSSCPDIFVPPDMFGYLKLC